MLKSERYQKIMELIREQQSVKVTELQALFHVSDETIRRDLAALERQGLLRCIHGGAVYDAFTAKEYHVDVRIQTNQREKEAICQEACKLIRDGESLAISASTTTLSLGPLLAKKNNLTVVTNSIVLANQISENASNEVILTGGRICREEQKTMGPQTIACFQKYYVDKALFSVSGVTLTEGLTEYSETEAELLQAVMHAGREKMLLSDVTKYSVVALHRVAQVKNLRTMVTDWHMTKKELAPYEALGIQVCCAVKP